MGLVGLMVGVGVVGAQLGAPVIQSAGTQS
jgi:hypothetical protein